MAPIKLRSKLPPRAPSAIPLVRGIMHAVERVLLGLGVAVGIVLLLGVVVAFTTYEEAKPYIEREYPTELYHEQRACGPCTDPPGASGFRVVDGMREVRADLQATFEAAGGAVHIVVYDPAGRATYDHTFTGDAAGGTRQESPAWSPAAGEWTIQRTFVGFRGTFQAEIVGVGIPPGSLG